MIDDIAINKHLVYFLTQTGCLVPENFVEFVRVYLSLLEKWNRVYNLTRVPVGLPSLYRHVLESLSLLPVIAAHCPANARCIDVGTGPGIPGLILAAAAPQYPMHLVDTSAKKISFVRSVLASHALPQVNCHHQRIEAWDPQYAAMCIVSRAFADLRRLIACTQRCHHPHGLWLAMVSTPPDAAVCDDLYETHGVVVRAVYHHNEVWPHVRGPLFLSPEYQARDRYLVIVGSAL